MGMEQNTTTNDQIFRKATLCIDLEVALKIPIPIHKAASLTSMVRRRPETTPVRKRVGLESTTEQLTYTGITNLETVAAPKPINSDIQ